MTPPLNPAIFRNVTFADFVTRTPALTYDAWRAEVNRLSLAEYGYAFIAEHGDDENWEEFHANGETPREVVDWFAQKFDLTRCVNPWVCVPA